MKEEQRGAPSPDDMRFTVVPSTNELLIDLMDDLKEDKEDGVLTENEEIGPEL